MRERRREPQPRAANGGEAGPGPPVLSNRAVARSLAAQAAPAGRGLRPDAAIARLASPRRAIARTATKIETYGTFSIDNYDPVDSDKDNDTNKSCGINIDVTYTPPPHIKSNKIGFVQMMKCLKGDGTPLLFENEKPRATDAASGDEGWAVDRLKNMKQGYYGMEDNGTAGGNLKLGSRTDKDTAVDATMHDRISLGRQTGKTAGCTAMTFAIDIEHGKYLGGFCWGYSVDASGKVTGNPLVAGEMGDVQRAAIKAWNAQAKNKDRTKRNARTSSCCRRTARSATSTSTRTSRRPRDGGGRAGADARQRRPVLGRGRGPDFPPEAMRLLEGVPDVEQALLRVATDEEEPLARRFAAVEALFQGGWTSWRSGPQGAAVARVMADAIRADGIHNRWGLPEHYVSRSGTDLLSIQQGVEDALTPLLDDDKLLTIHGGETATVAHNEGYTVADLARYLLAQRA